MIDIDKYNSEMECYEFAKWFDDTMAKIGETTEGMCIIRNRKDRMVKKMMEEAVAISRYALFMSHWGLSVTVRCNSGSENYDGEINIDGFLKRKNRIEVVSNFTYDESLRMELLNSKGGCFVGGKIYRDQDSREIIEECVALNGDHHVSATLTQVKELISAKVAKDYDRSTILLVNLNYSHWFSLSDRCKFMDNLNEFIKDLPNPFFEISIIFPFTRHIECLYSRDDSQ